MQEYGTPLSLAEAKRIVEAAEAEAARNGWAMVIAIFDSAGQLLLLHRMDGAQYGSVQIAQDKGRTAINFKRSTKVFQDSVAQGGAALRILAMEGVCPLEGGLPIDRAGRIVGSIGVSGAKSDEDGIVAQAGIAALDA